MTFVSFEYLVLLLGTFTVYYFLPWRLRITVVLVASYVFYAYWEPWYAYLIGFTTLMDYVAALAIHSSEDPRRRRLFLGLSLAANLGLLGYFKYTNFALDTLETLLGGAGVGIPHLDILLPAGISFYTFQEMSYTIDVYRRRFTPTRDPILFATFVSFFPQLVAGPIERADHLMPQLAVAQRFRLDQVTSGIGLIFIGLFKKLCLADRLTPFLYPKFQGPAGFDGYELLLSLCAMPVALYLDFGAYTDIARGSGRMLGVDIVKNFDFPFSSRNPGELWQRWHMSLTAWMRDYVFVALPGNPALSLLLPAALVGLWHGPHWKYVLWGIGNGLALGAYVLWRIHGPAPADRVRHRPLRILGTLLFWVYTLLLMALFFCPDVRTAVVYWSALFTPWETFGHPSLTALAVFLALFVAVQIAGRHTAWRTAWSRLPAWAQGAAFAVLFYLVLFGSVPVGQRFVYYQF
jgi:D-alanyl-lipoteichoic acid acyltransferase DltB (MBOAT superfamily)